MLKTVLLLCAVAGMSQAYVAAPGQKDPRDLLCTLCVDLVTDIDEFLTSSPTEQQIVEFVEQVRWIIF